MISLSLLICTIPKRRPFLDRLQGILSDQRSDEVEVLIDAHPTMNIGAKRNELLHRAQGKYVAFIDDDDRVAYDYIELLMEGIRKDVDCCSLKGIITENGMNPLLFEHSIKYSAYRTIADSVHGEVRYERYPNHLNCIKAEIAKQFTFPEKNHGEDTDWATMLYNSGLLKTEHYIPEVIYHYEYRSVK